VDYRTALQAESSDMRVEVIIIALLSPPRAHPPNIPPTPPWNCHGLREGVDTVVDVGVKARVRSRVRNAAAKVIGSESTSSGIAYMS